MRYLSIVLILLLSGCAGFDQKPGQFQHVVLVWFKEDVSDQYVQTVAEQTLSLEQIEGIKSIRVGRAVASDRPMVDDSFDLGVTMSFGSASEMETYVSHPKHKAFLKEYIQGKVEKVLIYDFTPDPNK